MKYLKINVSSVNIEDYILTFSYFDKKEIDLMSKNMFYLQAIDIRKNNKVRKNTLVQIYEFNQALISLDLEQYYVPLILEDNITLVPVYIDKEK